MINIWYIQHKFISYVDAEICSPLVWPGLYTNVYVFDSEDVNFFFLQQSL